MDAYQQEPGLPTLLASSTLGTALGQSQGGLRACVLRCAASGMAAPVLSAALCHFDAMRRERCPASLIQAQRDFFGAHTFARIDQPGTFHSDWVP